jgi:hypothetical protein
MLDQGHYFNPDGGQSLAKDGKTFGSDMKKGLTSVFRVLHSIDVNQWIEKATA